MEKEIRKFNKTDVIAREVIEVLNDFSLPFFVGGSKRWGMDDSDSDTDLFTKNDTKDMVINNVESILRSRGYLVQEVNKDKAYETGVQFQIENCVHLTFVPYQDYEHLKAEHDRLHSIMRSNIDLLLKMKMHGVDGKTRYRIMRDTFPA